MRYRKLDSNGDHTFGNGQADFYRDSPDAVAQAVRTRLMLWRGEFFLDTEEGTAWLQGVIGNHPPATRDTVIRTRIMNTEGFKEFISYESIFNPDTRRLIISTTISTIYGETTFNTEVAA